MRCPFCQEPDTRVLDTRAVDDGHVIRRRRECETCRRRFTTYERVEERPLMVVKREGRREPFSREKMVRGILKAVEKRQIGMDMIEDVASAIEREIRDAYDREVESSVIGEKVMDRLRTLDEVAYVRFASVYRRFTDVEGFVKTVDELKNQDRGRNESVREDQEEGR